jgi:cobalt-zinc-cadmium resistance protein CzcA
VGDWSQSAHADDRRVALVWSVADVFILGSEFLPTIDEGNMLVRATMPASISLTRAVEISTQIEKTLREFPEVETVVAKIGRAELGGDPESVSNDEIYVRLKPKSQWTTAKTKDAWLMRCAIASKAFRV